MEDGFQSLTLCGPPRSLTATVVGVVPFKFVCQTGAPAGLTNMTPLVAQNLWANGSLPLSLFDGNQADLATTIYAIGRNADSGTRQTAFAETAIGVQTQVTQYEPTNSSRRHRRADGWLHAQRRTHHRSGALPA